MDRALYLANQSMKNILRTGVRRYLSVYAIICRLANRIKVSFLLLLLLLLFLPLLLLLLLLLIISITIIAATTTTTTGRPGCVAEWTEHSSRRREVAGSSTGRAKQKALHLLLVVSLLSIKRIRDRLVGPVSEQCDWVVHSCLVSAPLCISVDSA